eukprot:gene10931-13389_t
MTPFSQVRIVILGQDPPAGSNQANGLAFSVNSSSESLLNKILPSSLTYIYQEIQQDLGLCKQVGHGDLSKWASQGVLLLNSSLTVRKGVPESHSNKGWEKFTDHAISILSRERQGIIFLLWGKHAQQKATLIDPDKRHTILTASHPSPFSASKGFFGCKHFSIANNILSQNRLSPIDWELSNNNNKNNNNHIIKIEK